MAWMCWPCAMRPRGCDRARAGEGPTLIECLTYRFRGHSLADPDELRSKEEKEEWLSRDPLKRFETYLLEQNLVPLKNLKAIRDRIQTGGGRSRDLCRREPRTGSQRALRYIFADE
jgi:pyruvate dehydrogenase E1 component alpha subunit